MYIEIKEGAFTHKVPKPLCGNAWLEKHINDHSHEEIEALGIEIDVGGKRLGTFQGGTKRGTVRDLIKINRR